MKKQSRFCKIHRLFSIVSILGILTIFTDHRVVLAEDYYQVTKNGGEQQINKHGECRKVKNNRTDHDIFVPVKTANEWLEFRTHPPANVTFSVCSSLLPDGELCAMGSECASGNCYVDADGDRYAPASGTKTCQANSQLAGVDCYDNNADVYPGQTTFFAVNRGDGSFDFNCDGVETKVDTCIQTFTAPAGSCSETIFDGRMGYEDSVIPGCGEASPFIICQNYPGNCSDPTGTYSYYGSFCNAPAGCVNHWPTGSWRLKSRYLYMSCN